MFPEIGAKNVTEYTGKDILNLRLHFVLSEQALLLFQLLKFKSKKYRNALL